MTIFLAHSIEILAIVAGALLVGYIFYREADMDEQEKRAGFKARQIITHLPK